MVVGIISIIISIFVCIVVVYTTIQNKKYKENMTRYIFDTIEVEIKDLAKKYVRGNTLTLAKQQKSVERAIISDQLDNTTQGLFGILEQVSPIFAKRVVAIAQKNPELVQQILEQFTEIIPKSNIGSDWKDGN